MIIGYLDPLGNCSCLRGTVHQHLRVAAVGPLRSLELLVQHVPDRTVESVCEPDGGKVLAERL